MLQRLEPLRRDFSEEILIEVRKREKAFRCLCCLDTGEVQGWLIRKYEIIPEYRASDPPMACKCGATTRFDLECMDRRLSEETCDTLHELEVERWKEAIAPSPEIIRQSIAEMTQKKAMKPLTKEQQLAEALGVDLGDDYDF